MLPAEARATLQRRVRAPDSSRACQASVRDAVRNVLSCGSEAETRRKWEKATAQMWTRAAGVSDYIRNAKRKKGGKKEVQQKPVSVPVPAVRKSRQMALDCYFLRLSY